MPGSLEECVWFYTGADYLIINAFLWKNREALEPCLSIVWENDRAVIREAEADGAEKRFASSGLDAGDLLRSYVARTPDELTHEAKRRMLEQAISDIRLLCGSMSEVGERVRLYRNVEPRFRLMDPGMEKFIELYGLTSASTTGQLIDYGVNDLRTPAQVLLLDLPAGTPALFLDNEEHEVILPPMRYAVKDAGETDGTPTVTLEAVRPLDIEELIRSAKESFAEYFN